MWRALCARRMEAIWAASAKKRRKLSWATRRQARHEQHLVNRAHNGWAGSDKLVWNAYKNKWRVGGGTPLDWFCYISDSSNGMTFLFDADEILRKCYWFGGWYFFAPCPGRSIGRRLVSIFIPLSCLLFTHAIVFNYWSLHVNWWVSPFTADHFMRRCFLYGTLESWQDPCNLFLNIDKLWLFYDCQFSVMDVLGMPG